MRARVPRILRAVLSRGDVRLRRAHRVQWGQARPTVHKLEPLRVAHVSRIRQRAEPELDARAATDLDVEAVFEAVDRTNSRLGQEALYHRLHSRSDADERQALERLAQLFSSNADVRASAQEALQRVNDPSGYDLWWLGAAGAVETKPWRVVFPFVSAATFVCAVGSLFAHALLPALVAAIVVVVILRVLTSEDIVSTGVALRHIAPLVATGEHLVHVGAMPAADDCQRDLAALIRLKNVSRWLGDDPLMLAGRSGIVFGLARTLGAVVFEYLNILFMLDANAVFFGAEDLRRHNDALLRVLKAVGDVDVALSVASLRAERADWTIPVFVAPECGFLGCDLTHPLLQNAVANTVRLEAGRGALVIGSNMSGKSTFLRTVGINAVLAQVLNTCLASRYEAPEFIVRTCIGRADAILEGKSYYLAEVEAVLDCVRAAEDQRPHLVLFDELFRGTNAVERIAAGEAVLRTMASGAPNTHVTVAATHDVELVDWLADIFAAYHFGEEISDDGVTFDFKLTPGRARNRNAIALLAHYGAPEPLVARAIATAAALDAQRSSA